jgi:ribosomal protein L3 glutamine methyltransferase
MPSAERRGRAGPSLRALLRSAASRLVTAGVSFGHGTTNARDEAAWLAVHALGLAFEDLDSSLDRKLAPAEARRIEALVGQRITTRKPAAYLTHEAWLGRHRFYVDERVIVPRSYIAELLRDALHPWLPDPRRVKTALDLCTGSGCLAILLALAFTRARIDAADISADALAVARRNVSDYAFEGRVALRRSDVYSALRARRYDLIVSNPPYVRDAVMRRLPAEYRREPAIALAGGRDGLDLVRKIVARAPAHLNEGGLLVVEVGHNRERVERAFPDLPFAWPETSGGDDCVFVITREALTSTASRLRAPVKREAPGAAPQAQPRAPARAPRATKAAASPRPRAARSPARASASAAARRRRSAPGSGG